MRRTAPSAATPLCVGDLIVDAERARACIGRREVSLSPRQHALLQYLVRRAGQIAKRSEILSEVFECKFDPGTNVIDVHMAHLRRKLEGSNVHVETVRGEGFRLQRSALLEVVDVGASGDA